ncbi:MAG: HAD family hydrolase [bacterium]|jgi:phosphoglycolate phosphatase
MTRFQLICYDLDGTLLDSLADIAGSMNTVLRELGHPEHLVPAYKHFIGDGARVLAQRTLPEPERLPDRIHQAHQRFEQVYQDRWNQETRPYDGILQMLSGVSALGVRQAVLSNKPHRFTVQCVESLLPGEAFDKVYGQREGIEKKPDPSGLLQIAREMGVAPEAIAYVGDTLVDMQTAVNAGAFPVGVLWGFRDEAELRAHGAGVLLSHPGEFIEWLKSEGR